MKKTIRKILPPPLRAIRRNCGGYHSDKRLFAAHLLDKEISDETYLQIINALIFGNGVRKSTRVNRNAHLLKELLSSGTLHWDAPSIDVLDAGASVGMDALGNYEVLEQFQNVNSWCLGDLYTHILYDADQEVVFDQDGKVVQVLTDKGFYTLNFEFKYRIEPLFHLWNLLKTKRARIRYAGLIPSPGAQKIRLLHPKVDTHPAMEVNRMDVFKPFKEKYDLIICMNLLQPRYFSRKLIDAGNKNLLQALKPGGFLITGVTDDYRVYSHLYGNTTTPCTTTIRPETSLKPFRRPG